VTQQTIGAIGTTAKIHLTAFPVVSVFSVCSLRLGTTIVVLEFFFLVQLLVCVFLQAQEKHSRRKCFLNVGFSWHRVEIVSKLMQIKRR
jgi:hypothetical protein